MKRTGFITQAMKDLLIPSEDFYNLFPDGLGNCDKGEKSFFYLQTFPHVGDMVVGLNNGVPTLFKAQSITWADDNRVMIAPKVRLGYLITKVYPVCISDEILLRLGFKRDVRFHKFRLRLVGFHNIDIREKSYSEAYYIEGIGNVKYLHELQAVLRIYNIDKGILYNRLWVGTYLREIKIL